MIKSKNIKKTADQISFYTTNSSASNAENLSLPDPALLSYYQNLDNRTIWIDSEVDDITLELEKFIMNWNREDLGKPIKERVPITILFHSPGGDLDINNSLVDTITLSKTPVIGVNCGIAYSAACFIFLACHKRYTFPNGEFLLHRGSGSFGGTYDAVVSAILNYQEQINRLGEFVLSRTNISEEEFNENFANEWYLSADEAIEKGLCSKKIKSLDEIFNKK